MLILIELHKYGYKMSQCDIEEVDAFIGNKIYSLRLASGLSRQQLAEMIGVTHQQLHKYEKGNNRISVGRLFLIAKALGVEISYLYDGFDQSKVRPTFTQHQRLCLELSRNFMLIKNAQHQNAVSSLVKSLVKESA